MLYERPIGSVRIILFSEEATFQRSGARTEKALLLVPTSQHSLASGTCNMSNLLDQIGQVRMTGKECWYGEALLEVIIVI